MGQASLTGNCYGGPLCGPRPMRMGVYEVANKCNNFHEMRSEL